MQYDYSRCTKLPCANGTEGPLVDAEHEPIEPREGGEIPLVMLPAMRNILVRSNTTTVCLPSGFHCGPSYEAALRQRLGAYECRDVNTSHAAAVPWGPPGNDNVTVISMPWEGGRARTPSQTPSPSSTPVTAPSSVSPLPRRRRARFPSPKPFASRRRRARSLSPTATPTPSPLLTRRDGE